jgi:hypothetical protein
MRHLIIPGDVGYAIRAGTLLKGADLLAGEVPSNTCAGGGDA